MDEQRMFVNITLNFEKLSGKIKKKIYNTHYGTYLILNYDKQYICFDDKDSVYRSVVISYPEKEILSFSLPQSIPCNHFFQSHPVITSDICISQIIEGVSISLFYDYRCRRWEISTKNSITGDYSFYGKKKRKTPTFLKMFMDVFRVSDTDDVNTLAFLEYLPKWACYNFVLQHPANPILFPINTPRLFLVSVYEVYKNEVLFVPSNMYESWDIFSNIEGVISFPQKYDVNNYSDLLNDNAMLQLALNIDNIGYMITNTITGERCKIYSKKYEDLKRKFSIKPNILYHFLCFNRIGKERMKEYLSFFHMMKKDFIKMNYEYEQFINAVHQSYISYYVKRSTKEENEYFSHIYKIHHNIYLPSLVKKEPVVIKRKVVKDYFNSVEPRELLYFLNWDLRSIC
jgi:hypothetical protein